MKHRIREELTGVAIFLGVIWAVFFLDLMMPFDLAAWGVKPRSWSGLIGIPLSPFLHHGFSHLLANTMPLAIMLMLLAGSRADSWFVVTVLVLFSGALLWLVGRNSIHVGASSLVFGLMSFLIASGFFEKRLVAILIALFVGFFYGTTLVWGVVPQISDKVSWEGHLCGAVAGVVVAWGVSRFKTRTGEVTPVSE